MVQAISEQIESAQARGSKLTSSGRCCEQNVGNTERAISALSGAGLVAWGLSKPSAVGGLLSVVGAALLHRGVSGYCGMYGALGVDTATHQHEGRQPEEHWARRDEPARRPPRDVVAEASEESFPASDAPGWIEGRT